VPAAETILPPSKTQLPQHITITEQTVHRPPLDQDCNQALLQT
jgi:hypothetical protein